MLKKHLAPEEPSFVPWMMESLQSSNYEVIVKVYAGREKVEMNDWGQRGYQRGKSDEVKITVISPITKMDTEASGLVC